MSIDKIKELMNQYKFEVARIRDKNKEKIKEIFEKIDIAIESNISKEPIPLKDSKFYREYLNIKGANI